MAKSIETNKNVKTIQNVETVCRTRKLGIGSKKLAKLGLTLFISAFLLLTSAFVSQLLPAVASADSVGSQLNLSVSSVIALTATPCADLGDTSGVLSFGTITPSPSGTVVSKCQLVQVDTNAPSYWVNLSSTKSTMDHNPDLAASLGSNAVIPSVSSKTTLGVNTWGFAVPTGQSTSAYVVAPFSTFSGNESAYASSPISQTFMPVPVVPSPPSDISTNYTFVHKSSQSTGLDAYKLFYGVNVTNALPSGAYQNVVTYTAVAEDPPEPIYPNVTIVPNIASTVSPSGNGTGTSGVLDNGPQFSLYAVSGINFGANPTVTIGGRYCTEIVVNSAGTSITCSGPTSGMTAGEKKVLVNGIETTATVTYDSTNYPTLQSLTGGSGTCLGTGTTPAIYRDARDSQLYYVAKLADNKCWMLDNLKYKPNGDTSGTVTGGFVAEQVANTGQYLTVDGTNDTTVPNQDIALYIDSILDSSSGYCRNNANKPAENITKCGLLYNWYTVTAGTAPQASFFPGQNADGSICPINWHLPTGYNTFGDFAVLDIAYGGTGSVQTGTPAQLATLWLYTGVWRGLMVGYYGNSFINFGGQGFYWSSSASGGNASRLNFASSQVAPTGNSMSRSFGAAVRCVN